MDVNGCELEHLDANLQKLYRNSVGSNTIFNPSLKISPEFRHITSVIFLVPKMDAVEATHLFFLITMRPETNFQKISPDEKRFRRRTGAPMDLN